MLDLSFLYISLYKLCNFKTNSEFGNYNNCIFPTGLEIKDNTDTEKSASHLDLHHRRMMTLNFPFMCSNILAVPV